MTRRRLVLSFVVAAFGVGLAPHGVEAATTQFPTYAEVDWSADGGIPIELADGATLYLFGDTVKPGSFVHNSAAIVRQGVTLPLWSPGGLLRDGTDSWFWPGSAFANPDGSLTVVANEVRRDNTSWFGFDAFDTDLFIVTDPYSVMSWRLAQHIDAGPWDGLNVSFLDATSAAVRPFGSDTTYLADLTTPDWDRTPLFAGEPGGGTFIPVEHDGVLYGVTWHMTTGHVQLWRGAADAWVLVDEWDAEPGSYGHRLAEIDGRVVYLHSPPGDGYELGLSTVFPVYLDVTDLLP